MKLIKRNQAIIYIMAIMIMTAGYLNYTTNTSKKAVETSMQMESKDDTMLADIGDATLVNSNDVVTEKSDENEKNEQVKQNNEITDKNVDNKEVKENISDKDNQKEQKSEDIEVSENLTKDDYFEQSKLERETMFSQMIETYEKLLNSDYSLETQKQTATQEITKINQQKNSIMICENLIKTKGFEDIVIFVNGESISVIVKSEELTQEQIAQIQNIISREMNAKLENIHISAK